MRSDNRSGALYIGEWLSLAVHNIHGLEPHEWFLTSADLRLDCVRLDVPTLAKAKEKATDIADSICLRYREDIKKAAEVLVAARQVSRKGDSK